MTEVFDLSLMLDCSRSFQRIIKYHFLCIIIAIMRKQSVSRTNDHDRLKFFLLCESNSFVAARLQKRPLKAEKV